MQTRWSPAAADDLQQLFEYIRADNVDAALRVAQAIYERIQQLSSRPYIGRPGRVEETRELPLSPLPFIVIYRVLKAADVIEVINIIHGAQRWPPAG